MPTGTTLNFSQSGSVPFRGPILALRSKESKLASKAFWGQEMLQQRLSEMSGGSRRHSLTSSPRSFPTLRHHPEAPRPPPSREQNDDDSLTISSSSTCSPGSPLLPFRKHQRNATALGTYRRVHVTRRLSAPESDDELQATIDEPQIKLGSKEAKIASTSFWGSDMLEKRLQELSLEAAIRKNRLPSLSRQTRSEF